MAPRLASAAASEDLEGGQHMDSGGQPKSFLGSYLPGRPCLLLACSGRAEKIIDRQDAICRCDVAPSLVFVHGRSLRC